MNLKALVTSVFKKTDVTKMITKIQSETEVYSKKVENIMSLNYIDRSTKVKPYADLVNRSLNAPAGFNPTQIWSRIF